MSLLMEALKKAERSKQAQGNMPDAAPGKQNPPGVPKTPDAELSLLSTEQTAAQPAGKSESPPLSLTLDQPVTPELTLSPDPFLSGPAPDSVRAAEPPAKQAAMPTSQGSETAERRSALAKREAASPGMNAASQAEKGLAGKSKESTAAQQKALKDSDFLRAEARERSYAPKDSDFLRAEARERSYAKAVFAAKQPARSRTVLLAGAAAIALAGLAVFGYYYWQIVSGGTSSLSPEPARQAAMPAPSAAVAPREDGALRAQYPGLSAQSPSERLSALAKSEAAPPGTNAAGPAEKGLAGMGGSPPNSQKPLAGMGGSPPNSQNPVVPMPSSPSTAPASNPAIQIRQSTTASQINPSLSKAYQSFLSGDIAVAQQQYHKVLQQEPNSRDALLGMAAIALSRKQSGQAAAYYGKLLELNPDDPEAMAGLVGVQGQTDPVQSESRLKKILALQPQAGAVHFALGNLYIQQSRWAEAQQSYFRAYSSAPGNADYAFNVAVSLDHLNQGKLALEYYQRALELAQSGPASFDKIPVQNRIKELRTIPPGLPLHSPAGRIGQEPVADRSPSEQKPAETGLAGMGGLPPNSQN